MDREKANQNVVIVGKLNNFTEWMYSQIKPYLRGNILEVGSGRGTFSQKVIRDFPNNKIILSDIDEEYLCLLKNNFQNHPRIPSILKVDLEKQENFKQINFRINTIFALNVLEHVGDDLVALQNIYNILEEKGRLILLIPAHKFLYNSIDKSVGHYRRYARKEILDKISKVGFKIKKNFYFNFLAIFGWYLYGNILKKKALEEKAPLVLNKMVPLLKFLETHIFKKKIGISLILILEK